MPGQPRDKVSPIVRLIQPSRTGGQSERLRSGTVAHGYVPGSPSQTLGFLQYPHLRSSQVPQVCA